MKLTAIDNRVRIDFNGAGVFTLDGGDVQTSTIVFGREGFDDLVWQYMYGQKTDGSDGRLPPRRCDNCRSAQKIAVSLLDVFDQGGSWLSGNCTSCTSYKEDLYTYWCTRASPRKRLRSEDIKHRRPSWCPKG
jgi:hypothetical protein